MACRVQANILPLLHRVSNFNQQKKAVNRATAVRTIDTEAVQSARPRLRPGPSRAGGNGRNGRNGRNGSGWRQSRRAAFQFWSRCPMLFRGPEHGTQTKPPCPLPMRPSLQAESGRDWGPQKNRRWTAAATAARAAWPRTSGPTRVRSRTLARCAPAGSATRAMFPRTSDPTPARNTMGAFSATSRSRGEGKKPKHLCPHSNHERTQH